MKKVLFIILAIVFAKMVPGQTNDKGKVVSKSGRVFYLPKPVIIEIKLRNGNKATVELADLQQKESIGSLDSLLSLVLQGLQVLKDTISKPLISRRIDYYQPVIKNIAARIWVIEYPQRGKSYKYIGGELTPVKTNQDTLRIQSLSLFPPPFHLKGDTISGKYSSYYLMLSGANISDLALIPKGTLDSAFAAVKKELSNKKIAANGWKPLLVFYDVQDKKTTFANTATWQKKTNEFIPHFQSALQYAKGSWVPSAGVGFQYIRGTNYKPRNVYKLFWEPYFFFNRNESNKIIVDRNDFITFKYKQVYNDFESKELLYINFSLGYLISRKGEWFDPTTFKFSIPGFQYKNALLEPEFIFSRFFKKFSPSLKLTLEIE